MTSSSIEIAASPEVVFESISDPTTYPEWLVGARSIRDVDDSWPIPGSSFRHVIGVFPVLVAGSTTSVRVEPGRRLDLRAGMGPLGAAEVSFRLNRSSHGHTVVEIDERFVAGPAGWSWRFARPFAAALVWGRNAVSLDALRSAVEDRSGGGPD